MIRRLLSAREIGRISPLRHNREVSRLEGFSDAVFGFALTLLVSSQGVPTRFDELHATLRGFLAFGLCFATLSLFWYSHYLFFRRYALEDGYAIVLNTLLLFVLMFNIYPLKFAVTWVVDILSGTAGAIRRPDGVVDFAAIRHEQIPLLMRYFAASLGTIGVVYSLLHLHAYRHRAQLKLNRAETFEVGAAASNFLGMAAVGFLTVFSFPRFADSRAGIVLYIGSVCLVSIGPALVTQWRRKRLLKKLDRELAPES